MPRDPRRGRRQGDPHRRSGEVGLAAQARACDRDLPQGDRGRRARRDQGIARRLDRVVGMELGGARRGLPQGGRSPRRPLARHDQRVHDARPVQDGIPVGDRRRLRDGRLLALQRRVRAGPLSRAADLGAGDVESARVSRARGLRVCRLAVQLHGDRRQPRRRTGADGEYDPLEARHHGDPLGLEHATSASGSRNAAGRDQLPPRRCRDDLRDRAHRSRTRRRALHRLHRCVQQHVGHDRQEHGQLPFVPAHRWRDRRQGLHARAPVGRRPGLRGRCGARRL